MEMEKQISLEKIYKKLENLEVFMKKFEHVIEDVEFLEFYHKDGQ
ncbi:MAG: hypothetical protein AABX84_01475 [Nanoarchaeota archaeon]